MREAFEKERSSLIALPGDRFPADERAEVIVGKTPYARFDKNDYSVPHTRVRRTLVVMATLDEVRILDGADVIATHRRSFDKGACIEVPEHIADLARQKRHARRLRGQDRLVQAAPNSERLLDEAAKRGGHLGSIVGALLRLLDEYGAAELEAGIDEALKRGVPHSNAVRLSLTRRREQQNKPPPIPVELPKDPRVRDIAVRDHDLTGYDGLAGRRRGGGQRRMTDSLMDRARALGLHGLLAHWDEVSECDWLTTLIAWEEDERRARSLKRRLADARLGEFKPVADFNWDWPRRCDRMAVEDLMGLEFLKEAANVVLVGPNGVGKSTIAANIAHRAVLEGHTVRFATAASMLGELAAIDSDTLLQRKLRFYARQHLLVIDEVGYLSYSNRHADLLFNIVSSRTHQNSTMITTNRPFAEWGEAFPNASCVVALVDRLVHNAEIIAIDGDSYRRKEAEERQKQRSAERRRRREAKRSGKRAARDTGDA